MSNLCIRAQEPRDHKRTGECAAHGVWHTGDGDEVVSEGWEVDTIMATAVATELLRVRAGNPIRPRWLAAQLTELAQGFTLLADNVEEDASENGTIVEVL